MHQQQSDPLERQQPLRLTVPASVDIVGCGGVGSWIAYFLALAGVRQLWLWDDDEVGTSNLNRWPFGLPSLGLNKARMLRQNLMRLSNSTILAMGRWTPFEATREPIPEWVVAATDSWQSRRDIHEWAKECLSGEDCGHAFGMHEARCKYVEASAEGEFGGVAGSPAPFVTPEESQAGYASVPVHVGPCVMAASLACYHILHGVELGTRGLRLGWSDGKIELQA